MIIITEAGPLEQFCQKARQVASLAIDTEFERERTYKPVLQLIQIAVPGEAVIVDPLALEDLGPLWELVADPAVETILHAAGQDMEIFYDRTRRLPHGLFDTQVAAALLGMGEQPGYADLLRRVLNVHLKKHQRVTDWGRRPLSDAQLSYALDDVNYLHSLRDRLGKKLESRGRVDWLRQELAYYEEESTYVKDPLRLWKRVSRHRSLDGKRLAILRELAAWRERTAESRNIPRVRVLPDDLLVELSRRAPEKLEELKELRRLNDRQVQRDGQALLDAVQRGLELPREEWPRLPVLRDDNPDLNVTVDLLGAFVRHRARDAHIAPSYLATKKDLSRLAEDHREDEIDDSPSRLLEGWRFELVGKDLLELLEGRAVLGINPQSGNVEVFPKS